MGEGERSVEFALSSRLPLRAPGAQPSGPTEKSCRMCLRTISAEQQKGEALFPSDSGCPRDGGTLTLDLEPWQAQGVIHCNCAEIQGPRGCTMPPGSGDRLSL